MKHWNDTDRGQYPKDGERVEAIFIEEETGNQYLFEVTFHDTEDYRSWGDMPMDKGKFIRLPKYWRRLSNE